MHLVSALKKQIGIAFLLQLIAMLCGIAPAAHATESWIGSGAPGQGGFIRGLYVHPFTSPTKLLAGVYGAGMFTSTLGGTFWAPSNTGLGSKRVRQVRGQPITTGAPAWILAATEGGMYRSTDGGATWSASNSGLQCLVVSGLEVFNSATGSIYGDADTVYAGTSCATDSGVYKSINGGVTWNKIDWSATPGVTSARIGAITVANATGSIAGGNIWASSEGQGLFRSVDGGATWLRRNGTNPDILSGPNGSGNSAYVNAVRQGSGFVLASVEGGGVFRSLNSGGNWTAVNTGLPTNPTILNGPISNISGNQYVAVAGLGFYKNTIDSTNAPSWTFFAGPAQGLPAMVRSINDDLNTPTTWYATTLAGVYRSLDSGASWSPIINGLGGGYTHSSTTDPTNPNVVLGAAGDAMYRSTDGGATWVKSSTGLTDQPITPRFARGLADVALVGTTDSGVFKTTDGGATWFPSNTGLPAAANLVGMDARVRVDPLVNGLIYVTLEGQGVYKSADYGATWSGANNGLTGLALEAQTIGIDPGDSSYLYLTTAGGYYRSADAGALWSLMPGLPTSGIEAGQVNVDPNNSAVAYAAAFIPNTNAGPAAGSGVWKTTDFGNTWTQVLNNKLARRVAVVGAGGYTSIYAGVWDDTGGGVLKSVDGGATWTQVNTGLTSNYVRQFETTSDRSKLLRASLMGGGIMNFTNGTDTAVAGVAAALEAFKTIVNTNGINLDYTHLFPGYDVGFLGEGLNATADSKKAASDLRGVTLTSFTITKINSYDDVTGVINVAGTVTGTSPEGPFTDFFDGNNDGIFIFKRQGDGSYRIYGNQQIAKTGVQVSMQTDYGPGFSQGPRQNVNFNVEAPVGILSTATNAHSVPTSSPNNWTGAGQLPLNLTTGSNRTETIEGSPGVPETITNNAFFGGFEPGATPVATGTVFQFTLTKADTTPVTYNVPVVGTPVTNTGTDAITNVMVNGSTATSFPASVMSSPIIVGWTLPTGYAIREVRLNSHAHVTTDDTCQGSEVSLGAAATSGQVTVPSTCPSGTVNNVGISVQTEGFNGESSQFIYHFDIATAGPPPAPTGVTATPFADGSIQMSWNAVSGATGYNIYMATLTGVTKTNYASLGGHSHTGIAGTTYTHPAGAAAGTTYYLVVTALNAQGESVESAQLSATIPAVDAPAVTLSTSSLNFGSQTVGVPSANQSVTITNSGSATLNIASILSSPLGEFVIVGNICGATLAASASCQVTLSFVPQATGARTGSLTITNDATGSPHSVTLSGTGTVAAPTVGLSTSNIIFGNVTVGQTSATQSVTVTNTDGGTLSISAAAVSGTGFAGTSNTCVGANLTASQTCSVSITLSPSGAGAASGSLTITSNAAGSPHTVNLTGTGVAPGVATLWTRFGAPNVSNSVRQGQTATYRAVLVQADGTIVDPVAAIWSITSGPASVDSNNGVVTAGAVSVNTPATLVASFTDAVLTGGATVTDTRNLTIQASQDHWTGGTSPAQGGDVRSVTPVGTDVLVAVYGGGIHRTSDGFNWAQSGYGIPSRDSAFVRNLRTVPNTSNMQVLAAVEGRGIYRSADRGVTWALSNTGMGCDFPRGFTAGNNNTALYVAAPCGVYKSGDGGNTWTVTGLTQFVQSVTAFGGSDTVWAVTRDNGLYRSPDGGATWAPKDSGLPGPVYSFNAQSNVLLAMVEGAGIFRSNDDGASWVQQNSGLPASYGFQGGIGFQNGDGHFYVSVEGYGLYRGTTGANTSDPVNWGPWGNTASQLPMSARTPSFHSNSGSYFVGTGQGVFRSADSGASWTKVNTGLPGGFTRNSATDPDNTSIVYATADTVYKSTDGGATWAKADNGITSTIGGSRGSGGSITRRSDGALYVSTGNGGIFKSTDGAVSWAPVNNGLPAIVGQGVSVRGGLNSAPQTLYALFGADPLGVYKTVDGGANWSPINGNLPASPNPARLAHAIATDPATGDLYLGTEGGLYKSVNNGTIWAPVYTARPVDTVRVDNGTTPSSVYWSTYVNNNFNDPQNSSGLYRSFDGGLTFSRILSGNLVQNFRALRFAGVLTLYVASWNPNNATSGVLKSADGGTTWQTINSGLSHRFVGGFDPVNEQIVRASTHGGGVFNFVSGATPGFAPMLVAGWNLLGNARNTGLDVAAIFGNQDPGNYKPGITDQVASIWKWNASASPQTWAFYSPMLTAVAMQTFADNKGYTVLTQIGAGEGYWVLSMGAMSLPPQSGSPKVYLDLSPGSGVYSRWNLLATGGDKRPTDFNSSFSVPDSNVPVPQKFISLWAWDAQRTRWYFYAPSLEGPTIHDVSGVEAYADSKGYLHFEDYGKVLGDGVGFWLNMP